MSSDPIINFFLQFGKACHLWIDHLWVKALVFLVLWFISYLVITPMVYTQAMLWLRMQVNKWVALLGAFFAAGVTVIMCIMIDAVAVWYTSPLNVYLPLSAVDPGYTKLWVPFIIVAAVATIVGAVIGVGIWIELHWIREHLKQK